MTCSGHPGDPALLADTRFRRKFAPNYLTFGPVRDFLTGKISPGRMDSGAAQDRTKAVEPL